MKLCIEDGQLREEWFDGVDLNGRAELTLYFAIVFQDTNCFTLPIVQMQLTMTLPTCIFATSWRGKFQ